MERVTAAVAEYREAIDALGAEWSTAVATSAMRDAENGAAFQRMLQERFHVDARTISGDEEARLTFLGATAGRGDREETVVIDIGGGSTEDVVGCPGAGPGFHTSTQMGSVRHTERFLQTDPPTSGELEALARDVHSIVPDVSAERAIAVAGTATRSRSRTATSSTARRRWQRPPNEEPPASCGRFSNGPIRTGRGTCHERALRFGRREAPIRCGFARTYVPSGDLRVCRRPVPTQRAHYSPACPIPLGEICLAGIHHRGVGEHVDERRLAGGEGALQRGTQLVGPLHELTVPAERAHDLVVAALRLQVGGHRIAVQELHRVLLERPDPVVPHDADDGDAVADERVELHAREAERAVAEQQALLPLRMRELCRERRAGPPLLQGPALFAPPQRVAGPRRAQRVERARDVPVKLGGHRARVIALRARRPDHHELRVVAERAAEPEPEVHRDAHHQRDVGSLQPGASRAREEVRVVGGHAAARQAVQEHGYLELLAERAQLLLGARPVEPRS